MFQLITNVLIIGNVVMAVVFEFYLELPLKALNSLGWAILLQLLLMEKSNG